ncbi:MAG: flagellar hook basal-body protein [Myxococcaceae bacterium]
MSNGMYVSMNGAAARLEQLDSLSDNLANVETPGFKASRPAFEAFLANGAPHDARQVHPAAVATAFDMRPGQVVRTNEPLDLLPEGNAFFQVKTTDGVAYTRDGRMHVAPDGTLMTAIGHPLLDRDGNIIVAPPDSKVTIDTNGLVHAGDLRLGELALHQLDGRIDRVGPGLLRPQDGGTAVQVAPQIRIGELETSNASALETTVQLITAQRSFESSMQAVQTYKQMDDTANQLGRVR